MGQTEHGSRRKKHVLIGFLSAAALISLLLTAFTTGGTANGASGGQEQTVYRESAVTRGDLTVGVTESTTATLKTHAIFFDFTLSSSSSTGSSNSQTGNTSIAIEEIFVKAGQRVKKGDPLVLLSSSDIQEAIDDLQSDYQEALVSLTEAQLSLQKGQLDAKSTYNSTILNSEFADATYENTIEQLEKAVNDARDKVSDYAAQVRGYTQMLYDLGYVDDYYGNFSSSKDYYLWAKDRVEICQDLLDVYEDSNYFINGSSEHERLKDNLAAAQVDFEYAEYEYYYDYSVYTSEFTSELEGQEEILEARKTARKNQLDAQSTLRQAEYNLSLKTATAGQDKEKTIAQAEIADNTYQLQISQLENNVESKQLAASNIQNSITKLQGYLNETTLVSPCDGVVTQVSYSAGDSVTSGTTILSVSDSANVYVYVSVAQDDILGVELGQIASLSLDAFDTITFDGEVDSIATTPARSASGSASYNVTIRVLGATDQIYEGMTGSATLITRRQEDVLYVSTRAVYEKDGRSYVKVKDSDGNLTETPITTGFSDGRNVEVSAGLSEGMTVIIESQVNAG